MITAKKESAANCDYDCF